MSFLKKFQDVAEQVGRQATAFGTEASRSIGQGSKELASGFTLEKEVR